jgi:outer membrane autotransporter protein
VGAEGSVSAASGVAIRYNGDSTIYDGSQLTVYNSGTITGNILATDMDDNSAGFVTNINGGTVVPAAKASTAGVSAAAAPSGGTLVGASLYQANVVNGGTLIVGHGGKTDSTEITGDFSQSSDGMLSFDIDMASAKSDRLTVRGDATIGGKLKVNAISVLPDITLPFLTVGGTLEHSLSAQSAIFDYAVSRAGNELSVSAESAHFAEPGFALNDDQDKIADHLQEIWDAGGGSFGTLFGTLGSLADDDGGSYESALSDMSPGVSGATAAGSIAMTQQRLDLLLSCPMFADGTSSLVETSCVWSQADAQALDQKAGGGVSGFDATTYALRAGAQFEVSPNWFVGIAGGYDRSDIRGDDDRVNADGDTLYAGVSLKHEIGPWLLSGAIAGSYGWYDNTRSIRIPGFTAQAEGDPEVYNLSARVRAAYTFAQDPYYVRPLVDLDLIYSHASGYRESGAGALDLLVDDAGQWSFHATPAIEVGTRVEVNETTVMRAFAGAGVSFSSVDSWDTSTRLASAPAGIGTFDSEVPLADVVGRFTAGLDLAKDNGFSVRVEYNGSFSDTYTSHGGSLRLSHKF